jgi:hypothetical protein
MSSSSGEWNPDSSALHDHASITVIIYKCWQTVILGIIIFGGLF